MSQYSYKDGRVWMQTRKFESYKLLLPYGMSDLTDPVGSLNPVREPDPGKRRSSVVVDTLQGEPALHTFNLDTRLYKTLNYMFGLRNKKVTIQAHLGACGRPDNYQASQIGFHFPGCVRGDMGIDRVAIVQGDDSPIAVSVPWSAEGLDVIDFGVEFQSARDISEAEDLMFATFIEDECGEGFDPGAYGYVGGVFSLYGAVVWRTTDKGQTFTNVGDYPFGATETISDGVVVGEPYRHRLIVARGTTDGAAPAEIAYAIVDDEQTVSFVNVNVGSTNGQFINKLFVLDLSNIFAVTNTGQIYKSINGGASWTSVKAATAAVLTSIKALRDGTVLAVGASNGVFLSIDFGATWSALSGITGDFTACELTPDGTIYVGDDAGVFYGSADGGVTWVTLSAQGVTPTAVTAIEAYGNDIIWVAVETAAGGRVVRSTDGGAGFYLWSLNIPTNTGVNDIDIVDANFVWIVGDDGFVTFTNSQAIGV